MRPSSTTNGLSILSLTCGHVDEDEPHRELAEHIAQMRARFGSRQFMEGFGLMNVEGDYFSEEEKKELAPGFKVKVIDEDNTLFFDTMECKQTE